MASARCYTKSGSVEKYEPVLFSGAVSHYPHAFSTNIIGPDSNGNYTITYNGYNDGNSNYYDCYCKTIYGDFRNGGGISKTFYFVKNVITIYLYINVFGYSYNGCVAFDCTVSGGTKYDTSTNKEIINNILKNNSINLLWEVVTRKGPFGNYTTRITSVGSLILNTWSYYDNSKQYYMDTGTSTTYCKPSSGMYNGVNWKAIPMVASQS